MTSYTRRRALTLGGASAAALAVTGIARAASAEPTPGAPGVGDPLYPTLGNGGYQVTHYDLTFDFTPVTYDFTGVVKMFAQATQHLSAFNLDTDGHEIDSVKVNGRDASWELSAGLTGQELTVTPASPLAKSVPFTVEVRYHGNGKAPRASVTGWNFGTDGGFACAAQSSRADTFFPCNDHPSDKATWTFHISAPEGFVATANGELLAKSPRPDGSAVWHFALRERMATELVGIAVVKGTYLYGTSRRGLRLRHVVPQGQEEKYAPIVERTADHLDWAEAKFGRYPFSVYGLHIYDGYKAALENQTLSLFSTAWFKLNAAGHPTYENTMIHELVHQWYGDSVTPKDWQQAWLNEGPAVYYQRLYSAEQGWEDFEALMKGYYARLGSDRALNGPPGLPKALGGFNIYQGGALVLYALRKQVGDAKFEQIMKVWPRRFHDSTVDSEDFIRHVVDLTGDASLDGFLRDWLFGSVNPPMPGHPDWTVPTP
ncbi:M1 family metallopeptidase [Streptomyces sp. TRM66268-LWL]|uniref:Aminopeptidase N n=1 Tax=Streptomyces polyasparticus TaxID=2767826 RepID=A0ABR7SG31_9ACTN|nr:M1 family metallopeptidase [Streptomyces polyasparticus]MBC9713333.1 M1 family metallopeptidase [Streptomyces polyasparticus]